MGMLVFIGVIINTGKTWFSVPIAASIGRYGSSSLVAVRRWHPFPISVPVPVPISIVIPTTTAAATTTMTTITVEVTVTVPIAIAVPIPVAVPAMISIRGSSVRPAVVVVVQI